MNGIPERTPQSDQELFQKLKWLMFFRVLFNTLMLTSTVVLQVSGRFSPMGDALLILYELISALFLLSFIYTAILPYVRKVVLFAYIQIAADTVVVTFIIFLTGSFNSLFSFLYLVVIVYSSIILFRNGSMFMAALCSIQYGVMVDLEFYGVLDPFSVVGTMPATGYAWSYVLYKVMTIMVACFVVAFLSGILAEQYRRTRKELAAMERHVKRVEKMAAVGEMAAGLAHEIRNPLASLTGSIQLLRDEIDCRPEREMLLRIILREADRLSGLVSDFLMFARPPAAAHKVVNISEAVGETVSLFQKNLDDKRGIQINRDFEPDIRMEIDPGHLSQVVWNLLLNASEAINIADGPGGKIDITVRRERERFAVVEIRDNGCGINPERISTIFDPFVTTKSEGTGLGLSIVHRIIESYGGRLDVESEVGVGSTFRVRFSSAKRS